MKKSELIKATKTFKEETRDALQLLYDNINKGQQKKIVKREEIKTLFDKYNVNYEK